MYNNKNTLTLHPDNSRAYKIGFFGVFWPTVMKELKIAMRYKANLLGGIVEVSIMVLAFFALSTAVNFRSEDLFVEKPAKNATFIFLLAGILLIIFQSSAFFVPLNSVSNELYNGTLEYLYSTPTSRYAYFLATIFADLIVRQIFFGPMLLLLLYLSGSSAILPIIAVMGVYFVMVIGIGILISCFGILYKQVGNIVGIISLLMQFLGGTYIPVQSMPVYIIWISYLLPLTYALDLIRYYAYLGNWNPVIPVFWEWWALVISAILYLLLSVLLLRRVEKHAKKNGLHLL